MGILADVFNQDIFGQISLTDSIIKLPEQPSLLGDMGLFTVEPISTTGVTIEEIQGKLSLVANTPRGTRKFEQPHPKRKVRTFECTHLQENDTVKADAVQNIRDFGNAASLQTVASVVNSRLQNMKNCISATREWHRVGAIQGLILDADASTVIYDLYAEFGVSQQTQNFDCSLTAPAIEIKTAATKVRRYMEHTLGGTPFTSIQAICGDDFWDAFITSKSVAKAYENWNAAVMLQGLQREGFPFGGIKWWNYSTKIGTTFLIPTANAFFVPGGTMDLMCEYMAPADYMETVNMLGQEYYAKQVVQPFDKGIDMEAQSNPLAMVKRPAAIVKGTFTT